MKINLEFNSYEEFVSFLVKARPTHANIESVIAQADVDKENHEIVKKAKAIIKKDGFKPAEPAEVPFDGAPGEDEVVPDDLRVKTRKLLAGINKKNPGKANEIVSSVAGDGMKFGDVVLKSQMIKILELAEKEES